MRIDNADDYASALQAELSRHASRPVKLMIVDDIAGWTAERDEPCARNPSAMAITDGDGADWAVLLRRCLTDEAVDGVLGRMRAGGFRDVDERLDCAERFLRHTVLHELAHLERFPGKEHEDECDRWAFERMEAGRSG